MLIASKCSGCQSEFRFPEDLAGTEVHCAKCGQMLVVPMPVVTSEETVVIATLAEPKKEKPNTSLPAERSASVVGALALLLLFLMSLFGVGAFATIWIATHLGPPIRITSAPPLHAIREMKQNVDIAPPKFKIDDKRFDKDMVKKAPPIGPKIVPPQTIIAALDRNGNFTEQRALAPSDPLMVGQRAYKVYLVQLEAGKKYRIEMSLGETPTSLTLFDPKDNLFANTAAKKDVSFSFVPNQAGLYRIHAAAPLPKDREAYTLRVTTDP
jgi:hypothetical protein